MQAGFKPIITFAYGSFYLVSGVYSLGFSLFMEGLMSPVNGKVAYTPAPDGLFHFEVALFAFFGAAFLIAAAIQFRKVIRSSL